MKAICRVLLFTLFLCIYCASLLGQEKTQYYYNSHEREILPDANTAFQNGNYDRTITLCRWHYIIVGDHAADSLCEKAERCARLSSDMTELILSGDTEAAFEKAKALLELNPNDPIAKELVEGYTAPEEVPVEPVEEEPVEEEPEEQPVQEDTIAVYYPPVQEEIIQEVQPEQEFEPEEDVSEVPVASEELPIEEAPVWTGPLRKPFVPRTLFVLKAGAALLDMKQIAPRGSFGVYNLGGSRLGLEAGAYVCAGLSEASLFGMDASLVVRAGNKFYPGASLGVFSCKGEDGTTNGLCGGFGATFIIGSGFCVEVGLKYYPKVMISGVEMVSTAGCNYKFPSAKQVLAGGIAPMFGIGWAF